MCASPQTPNSTERELELGVEPKSMPRSRARMIDACVVLAGGLRASPLVTATSRSILDLHIAANRTVLDGWSERVAPLLGEQNLCIAHGGSVPAPSRCESHSTRWIPVADTDGYRGPAGVVRDACSTIDGDGDVLVLEASRWIEEGLEGLASEHKASRADITLGINADGTPSGVYLIRREAIALVDTIGFIDIKEQWLPRAIREGFDVRGYTHPGSGSLPLRTLPQFLVAARACADASARRDGALEVVCRGSRVESGATLVDSIVMPGGVVEHGGVVVRSIVAPGGRVEKDKALVDGVASESGHFMRAGASVRHVVESVPSGTRIVQEKPVTLAGSRRHEAVAHAERHRLAA